MESTPTGYLMIVGADSISALLLEVSQMYKVDRACPNILLCLFKRYPVIKNEGKNYQIIVLPSFCVVIFSKILLKEN